MRTGKTLTELADELERQRDAKRDFLVTTPALRFESQVSEDDRGISHIRMKNNETFCVADTAHEQIAARLEIPKKYYDRMRHEAPELLDTNVNHWFENSREERMIRTLYGDVRGFLSNRYRPLDNYDLSMVSFPELKSAGCRIESCEVTERRLYIKAVTEKLTFEVKKGDIVQAGIVISNSEIGCGSLLIEPILYRLICLNGAIMPDSRIRKNHVGRGNDLLGEDVQEYLTDETRAADDKAFWMKVRDTIAHAFTQIGFDRHVAKFTEAAEDRFEKDPEKVIEITSKHFSLSEMESKGVLREMLKSGDNSRFGLINAVTAFAQNEQLSYDRATELERVGGQIIELPKTDWKRIAA